MTGSSPRWSASAGITSRFTVNLSINLSKTQRNLVGDETGVRAQSPMKV